MTEQLRRQDAANRERALDVGRSFIVQAPAGSGKTELLTQRYLVLLARVEHPEEIVSITFTNKAAGEMRDRVLKALTRAADATPPDSAHERRTWELARAVLAQDARRGWDLAASPRRLRIRTIDALNAALARAMPLTAGFGAEPAVVEDAQAMYTEAARATIALLEEGHDRSPAVENLLRHLDNSLMEVEQLLARMLARRDQWLRHVSGPGDPRLERATLEGALHHAVGDALAQLAAAVTPAESDVIVRLAHYTATHLDNARADSPLCACVGITRLPGAGIDDLAHWQGIATLLLTQAGEWRVKVDKRTGFPAPGDAETVEEKAFFAAAKKEMQALLERLAEDENLRLRLRAVQQLPRLTYTDEQWQVLEALTVLLPLAAAQLTLVFRRHGKVDFVAVAHGALAALGAPEEPTDLALALDYRIRHILVDEFQDTSFSQYLLLERLTAGWEPGDGRTLFAVGDPMQSIYRFREAEVGLYLRARREGIGAIRLEPLTLAVNFRSRAGVVDWVNRAFARVLPTEEDMGSGAVAYAPAIAHHPAAAEPAVTVHPQFDESPEREAARLATLLQTLRRDNPLGTVAILVRARGHLDAILPRLKREQIPFLALDIEPLGHRPVVQDLFALTRALEHPADRTAWLALLRAPCCGLALADLQQLSDGAETIWEALNDEPRGARLSADGRRRTARVGEILGACLAQRRRQPLRRAVEGAWLALGGPAGVQAAADLDDAEIFLNLLEELDAGGELEDLALLEQRVAKLFALPAVTATENPVQIMTIHKAKGLEFDTVIVPSLGRKPRAAEKQLLLWAERARRHGGADLLLAPIRASGADDDPTYGYLQRLEQERARYEDGRLLYVAATRARSQLHLLGQVKLDKDAAAREPLAGSLLKSLWPAVAATYARAAAELGKETAVAAPALDLRASQGLVRLRADWQAPPPPPAVLAGIARDGAVQEIDELEFDWARESARQVGRVVHRWLLRIATEGLTRWDGARLRQQLPTFRLALARLGVPAAELDEAAARVHAALANALTQERGRWVLGPQQQARSEYALTGVLDGRLVNVVLDRTFVDTQGVRWIVDYKTGTRERDDVGEFLDGEQRRYAAQLERYARLLEMTESRPVKLGLYFPLLSGWREWEFGRKSLI